ncbi:hypothetical protein [Acidipila sp. EB88]|uniref:hypothetical protein n=1 Tax=Acidipila sp. EB88 TaxID=2305226 RepID=UPI000F5D808A|nr:hypothetical protein [Acidipila sp. EB88]RRA49329.1 hypothetical protein D1Y84_14640 [Acidipila sp. EB88]
MPECRQLVFVAAANGEQPVLPAQPRHALCPYCLHAGSYEPSVLVLHSGYGTIYYPPERNLTDTTLLIAGFLAAIKLARVPEAETGANSPRVLATISESTRLARVIVDKLPQH